MFGDGSFGCGIFDNFSVFSRSYGGVANSGVIRYDCHSFLVVITFCIICFCGFGVFLGMLVGI